LEKEVSDMAGKRTAGKNAAMKKQIKQVRFEFPVPGAQEVFIAGEFNNWDERGNPLKRDENGVWGIVIHLPPGRYEYRFLTDGRWENDPSCSSCVPNAFGSLNCVRIVE
jgi:1,4-alpha-glucan branching enzyme